VPVLSKATTFNLATASTALAVFTRTPFLAAPVIAETIETGVEIARAHEHDTTRIMSALYTQVPSEAPNNNGGTMAVSKASEITVGV
jgi:hypothetical protein